MQLFKKEQAKDEEREKEMATKLVEKLKFFMAEKDLTIHDVAVLIKKDPKTIWQFLHQRVNPHDRTIYKIKRLLGNH